MSAQDLQVLYLRIIQPGAYLILNEVGIANLVCGRILRCVSVSYHPLVTVTLNLDLVARILINSSANILYYLR